MVIKTLLDAWRSGQVLRRMHNELLQMLEATQWMFQTVGGVRFEEKDPEAVAEELYDTDRLVNKTERNIRKEIVEHLTVRPKGDMPACLVLMSLVKDAERIGDYSKNLFEIRELLGGPFPRDDLVVRMRDVHGRIVQVFDKTRKALAEGDEETARRVVEQRKSTGQELEQMVREVADSDLPARNAVGRALCVRHMKRVHAHLCNIASGVVQPVHRIDYRTKKKGLPRPEGDEGAGESES